MLRVGLSDIALSWKAVAHGTVAGSHYPTAGKFIGRPYLHSGRSRDCTQAVAHGVDVALDV